MRTGLTFDDVLLVPKRSSISSRKMVDISTYLSNQIPLTIPIVAANMDTVTEANMAIAMATLGGIGIIHRFMSIEKQVKEVQRVKRYEQYIIEDPITVTANNTLVDAKTLMFEHKITGLLVVDKLHRLLGIVTARDLMFEQDNKKSIQKIMTPHKKIISADENISLGQAKSLLHKYRIEKLPLIDKKGRVKGLITARDILRLINHHQATKDKKGRLKVGAAIGVRDDSLQRAEALISSGCDLLVLDIAHGHSDHALQILKKIKNLYPNTPMIAGNVATAAGAKDFIKAQADSIKVGIGPGSMCTTRTIAGAGVPQLTAIIDAAKVCHRYGIPLIADGGIRSPADVAKAIAAGASTVMIGALFAGTDQSPGSVVIRNGKKYKISRGMASIDANVTRLQEDELGTYVAEGVEAFIPYRGDVEDIIIQLIGGLRSGMSYSGAENIRQFWQKAEFIQITPHGLKESQPHDVEVMI